MLSDSISICSFIQILVIPFLVIFHSAHACLTFFSSYLTIYTWAEVWWVFLWYAYLVQGLASNIFNFCDWWLTSYSFFNTLVQDPHNLLYEVSYVFKVVAFRPSNWDFYVVHLLLPFKQFISFISFLNAVHVKILHSCPTIDAAT